MVLSTIKQTNKRVSVGLCPCLFSPIGGWGRQGRDRMVVGLITRYGTSAHDHKHCGFESRSWRAVQHYMMKFVSDLPQVGGFLWILRFPPLMKLNTTI